MVKLRFWILMVVSNCGVAAFFHHLAYRVQWSEFSVGGLGSLLAFLVGIAVIITVAICATFLFKKPGGNEPGRTGEIAKAVIWILAAIAGVLWLGIVDWSFELPAGLSWWYLAAAAVITLWPLFLIRFFAMGKYVKAEQAETFETDGVPNDTRVFVVPTATTPAQEPEQTQQIPTV